MKAVRRSLVGRTIVDCDFGPFPDGRGGTAHKPVLILDNGRRLSFDVEETEVGEYGVTVLVDAGAQA